jgi:hypothetical protein
MAKTPTPSPDDQTPEPGQTPEPTEQLATEQLPQESAPVSASTAASGGETGLSTGKEPRTSVLRRHPLATAIAGGAIAVVLVSGLTAWGVGAAVTASLTSSTAATPSTGTMAMPTPGPTTTPAAGGKSATGRLAFRATIQSMGSDSWTILTKKGKTVTVAIGSTTQYGTKRMTATATSFAVGDNVVIVASRGTDGKPTATRIVAAMS